MFVMTFQERILYHQIHPLKLATDIGVTFPACYFLWRHDLVVAAAFALLPPVVVSAILIAAVDLEPYKQSAFGRYLATYMSREMEALRLCGFPPRLASALRLGYRAAGMDPRSHLEKSVTAMPVP